MAALALGLSVTLVFLGWTQVDLDGDSLTTESEWELGASSLQPDTDGDGLGDGLEFQAGTGLRDPDTDSDGLLDSDEYANTLDPLDSDMDDDGLDDGAELGLGTNLLQVDSDGDGLPDSQEARSAFSPLKADTFDVRLPDSVSFAFQQKGQPPGPDDDQDGIPDGWENATGLINWGPLAPRRGERDLLIEFVRVNGPASGRQAGHDFHQSYAAVAQYFQEAGNITLRWTETIVERLVESRPPILPSVYSPYYESVLMQSQFSGNPYVTTVVLNPQHDQSETVHLGIAPIRGMLAAVDYGAFLEFDFWGSYCTYYDFRGNCAAYDSVEVSLFPILESLVIGNRVDLLGDAGFWSSGRLPTGELYMRADGFAVTWMPDWFTTAPRYDFDDGMRLQLHQLRVSFDNLGLSNVILHELGHTLGLCHLELPDCAANLTARDRYRVSDSTMYTEQESTDLKFLPGEWDSVGTYLTCPPFEPLSLLAGGASSQALLEAKYGYVWDTAESANRRTCGIFPRLEAVHTAESYRNRGTLQAPPAGADLAPGTPVLGSAAYLLGAGALAWGAFAWRRTTALASSFAARILHSS